MTSSFSNFWGRWGGGGNPSAPLPLYETLIIVDQKIFTLKIIHVKNFCADKFSQFHSILEIFLRKMFYSCVKFSQLVLTAKLF